MMRRGRQKPKIAKSRGDEGGSEGLCSRDGVCRRAGEVG